MAKDRRGSSAIGPFIRLFDTSFSITDVKRAVVALESTIISHGMPYPQNLAMARNVEREVRAQGALPATVRNVSVIGPRTRVHLTVGAHVIEADIDRGVVEALDMHPGKSVGFRFRNMRIYPTTR